MRDWGRIPLSNLSPTEVKKKLADIKIAIELYYALQCRYEELSLSDERFNLADEQLVT